MILFLTLLSGLCWTIVYIESIRLGFKQKTYSMPLFALALNIGWEGLYAYLDVSGGKFDNAQTWVNVLWFMFDLLLVYTFFRYGKKEFSKFVSERFFIPVSLFVFVMAFAIQYSFHIEFKELSSWYSAFLQNLLMSVLYIGMFINRGSTKGQSLSIAISKWIGTLAPTILFGIIRDNQLVLVLGILCSVFDIAYIGYLLRAKKMH